jgi:hypothetical protein
VAAAPEAHNDRRSVLNALVRSKQPAMRRLFSVCREGWRDIMKLNQPVAAADGGRGFRDATAGTNYWAFID